ncbi:hypothetical protein HK414_01875 [Ramlibacter terrae]|uniref:DUF4398 domain-containing protein n=1 Tax=Ramlibacter terrae TaxID=2732511 RepID=A0ABX6P2N6_9BURK|nr:hypothetical protein HK414_01875 [Ramlibacter terrae]
MKTRTLLCSIAIASLGFGSLAQAQPNPAAREARQDAGEARRDLNEARRDLRRAPNQRAANEARRDMRDARGDLQEARGTAAKPGTTTTRAARNSAVAPACRTRCATASTW